MYRSQLHDILIASLNGVIWTRSTRDEDNFRQVVCSSIYQHIAPSSVEIPSTRSSKGDIIIFGRRIELKYASAEKCEGLGEFLQDFELLLEGKIEFSIMAVRIARGDRHLHSCVNLPMLAKTGAAADFGVRNFGNSTYKSTGIFLSATFPHPPVPIEVRQGRGKNSTSYLSFENATAIARSSFLEVAGLAVHVDVVGSQEDGLICFLFKRAENMVFEAAGGSAWTSIDIPYAPSPISIAKVRNVDALSRARKTGGGAPVSQRVIEPNVLAFLL